MSNTQVGNVYQQIIADVVDSSRVDFEEGGVDEAVLEELKKVRCRLFCPDHSSQFDFQHILISISYLISLNDSSSSNDVNINNINQCISLRWMLVQLGIFVAASFCWFLLLLYDCCLCTKCSILAGGRSSVFGFIPLPLSLSVVENSALH